MKVPLVRRWVEVSRREPSREREDPMRRWAGRLAAVALMAVVVVPVGPAAHAMMCPIDTGSHLEPNPDDVACDVFRTVMHPVCFKFHCS